MSSRVGAALAFFNGLRKKAPAAAASVGFAGPDFEEPENWVLSVFVVITMFFLDLPWSVFRTADAARALQRRE